MKADVSEKTTETVTEQRSTQQEDAAGSADVAPDNDPIPFADDDEPQDGSESAAT